MITEYKYGLKLIGKFTGEVWKEVDRRLEEYASIAENADKALTFQAVSSIRHKRFHALGGAVYALYPGCDMMNTIQFVTAFQTISDYLDNLCDRVGVTDEKAFRQLHLSMSEAVDTSFPLSDYYLYYPYKQDGGYLAKLVEDCRNAVAKLASYHAVKDKLKMLVSLYSEMQSLKHLDRTVREEKLTDWAYSHNNTCPEISPWEFSAAAGSTLGVFLLFTAAHDSNFASEDADIILEAYFPWICSLHILLDYYIDSYEDSQNGDLNFTSYYNSPEVSSGRLSFFLDKSLQSCGKLKFPKFHVTVIRGLLAMYLSDRKAVTPSIRWCSRRLIKAGGPITLTYYLICLLLRRNGSL